LGGISKGLLHVQGRTCLERLLELRSHFEEVLWVGGAPGDAPAGTRSVPDVMPGRGAPGGVHAALVAARTPWVMAVACDMPFVTGPVVQRLLGERAAGANAVCFQVGQHLQPFPGLYRAALASRWGAQLAKEPSLRHLLTSVGARELDEATLRAVDPLAHSVVSLNTPEDLVRWSAERPQKLRPLP
jgi:molybdopterin-guanine dinucleotide biosynthesis protein A